MGVFRRSTDQQRSRNNTAGPVPITAAAERLKFSLMPRKYQQKRVKARQDSITTWQNEAYEYYNQIGEIHYAFNLIATLASRVNIHPIVVSESDTAHPPQHIEDTPDLTPGITTAAKLAMSKLGGGRSTNPDGEGDTHDISDILRTLALNFLITGEAYLIEHPAKPFSGTPSQWVVHSISEVIIDDSFGGLAAEPVIKLRCNVSSSPSDYDELPPRTFIARLWRSDPQFSSDPASSMRPILPLCAELVLLNQAIRALVSSRMNAGALFIPDSLAASTAPPVEETDGTQAAEEDEFEEQLIEAMTLPIQDPASASSVVPLLIRGPADAGEKIRQFTFDRPFDETLIQRSDKVMDRILAGLDIPKDAVAGLSGVRYSNAIIVQDELLKSHVEPLIELMCDSLTSTYLHPYLVASGYTKEQAARLRIGYDSSPIVNRPNRSEDAAKLYAHHALSGSAWRRSTGFPETDAPNASEMLTRLTVERAQMTPELFESLLRVIAPIMMNDAADSTEAAQDLPPEVAQALGMAPGASEGTPAAPEPEAANAPNEGEQQLLEDVIPQGGTMPPREVA